MSEPEIVVSREAANPVGPSDPPPIRHSVLEAEHQALGAVFTVFAGWRMPLRYTSELAEHHAVRRAAGLFDLSHMGEIRVRGAQAGTALDAALVSEFGTLAVGRAKYTLMCDENGGVIDDLVVYRISPTDFLVVANAANTAVVVDELHRRCAEFNVDVRDETARWCLVALQGPKAVDILRGLLDEQVLELRYYRVTEADVCGRRGLVARTGYTGEDGFELFLDDDPVPLWRAILERGQDAGVLPCGLAARDSLRLEAGMPLYGRELSRDRTPFHAGLGRVVALDKPNFVGKAALMRYAAEPPNETLAGLAGVGRRAPRHGDAVYDERGLVRIGEVTSGAPSPTLGYAIAMAYLRRDYAAPNTPALVDVRGKYEAVTVTELPFYRRKK